MNDHTRKALEEVAFERERQDAKWGEQNHAPFTWLAILQEEVGELAQTVLHTQFGGTHRGLDQIRMELHHVAAVAVAMLECLDRWTWNQWVRKENT